MSIYKDLLDGNTKLSLVGLGYVGMPIAVEFSKHVKVLGFDINEHKIAQYKAGVDPTKEVGDKAVHESNVEFTCDPAALEDARFHIVAVPTPVNRDKTPDLTPVIGASKTRFHRCLRVYCLSRRHRGRMRAHSGAREWTEVRR